MEKVKKYQDIICSVLGEYASIKKSLTPNVKSHLIIDREHNQFQLLSIGWHNNRFVFTILFHFSIINGKVWIQQNNTDILIADEIMDKGVTKEDIVLGFVPEKVRIHSGFAVA